MDFIIGLIVGLFFGGWIGLAVASLITISRDKDIEDIEAELEAEEHENDPDGSKAVLDEMLAKMRESKRVPTCLANEERRKELEERYMRE